MVFPSANFLRMGPTRYEYLLPLCTYWLFTDLTLEYGEQRTRVRTSFMPVPIYHLSYLLPSGIKISIIRDLLIILLSLSRSLCTSLAICSRIFRFLPLQVLPLLTTFMLQSPQLDLLYFPGRSAWDIVQESHTTIEPFVTGKTIFDPLLDIFFGDFLFIWDAVRACGVLLMAI